MLPIDPGDGQGSVTPARPVEDIVPFRDRVPAKAMSRGGTIIRPGAVAWGGMRDSTDSRYSSCEAIERILAAVAADLGQLPGLLTELTTTQLWVPLPARHRPFTDGTAVRLPLIEADGEDFVPCFTSVQRLTAWVDAADLPRAAPSAELEFVESGRRWQRAGDARVVPHLVVPAVGLARRLPSGLGLALNADGANGVPLYPESVSYLARLAPAEPGPGPGPGAEAGQAAGTGAAVPWPTALRPSAEWSREPGRLQAGRPDAGRPDVGRPDAGRPGAGRPDVGRPDAGRTDAGRTDAGRAAQRAAGTTTADTPTGAAVGVGHPPVEPRALLDETRAGLRELRYVRYASRAWLWVTGAGEGLVISVALDDPGSEARRGAVIDALERACAAVPLRVPFPVDVTFPGEILPGQTSPSPDLIDEWIGRNTRPFYTRD
jgi:SseB protein N-terminal domain